MNAKRPESASLTTETHRQAAARVGEDSDRQSTNDLEWYSVRDLDEVDRAVREGRLRRVVFDSMDQLLAGLWSGEIDAEAWVSAGVQVELRATAVHDQCALLRALLASWSVNARRSRRRRVVAGVILSVIAVAAAFVLVWAAGG
jgi:hypothetical protein